MQSRCRARKRNDSILASPRGQVWTATRGTTENCNSTAVHRRRAGTSGAPTVVSRCNKWLCATGLNSTPKYRQPLPQCSNRNSITLMVDADGFRTQLLVLLGPRGFRPATAAMGVMFKVLSLVATL